MKSSLFTRVYVRTRTHKLTTTREATISSGLAWRIENSGSRQAGADQRTPTGSKRRCGRIPPPLEPAAGGEGNRLPLSDFYIAPQKNLVSGSGQHPSRAPLIAARSAEREQVEPCRMGEGGGGGRRD